MKQITKNFLEGDSPALKYKIARQYRKHRETKIEKNR